MTSSDYSRCAQRIVEALRLQANERVLIKFDPRVFATIIGPLQKEIRKTHAVISAIVLAEDTRDSSDTELFALRRLFDDADVFVWLPELNQRNRPALAKAIVEWLDAERGRAVHFHWQSGSYRLGLEPLPSQDVIDAIYLEALAADPAELDRKHQAAINLLRAGSVRVQTPEGTDIRFEVGDRPFSSQIGDASAERIALARTRIDRDIELPAGVLRVAPRETSANGSIFLTAWQPVVSEGRNLMLHFKNGLLESIEGTNGDAVLAELTAAGGAARMFREFALGFNEAIRVRERHPFIGYYGYGAGVVRLSLGDNEEMGGANRGGGVYWNFIHNATVEAGNVVLAENGKLTTAVDT